MVAVVVGEEHPTHVGRVDDRRHVGAPLLAVQRGAGVDDDGLLWEDHHGVHHHEGAGLGGHEVRDEVGVLGDSVGLHPREGRRVGEGAFVDQFGDGHVGSSGVGATLSVASPEQTLTRRESTNVASVGA